MKLQWTQIESGDREVWASQLLHDDSVESPFVIVLVAEDWADMIGESELSESDRRFHKKHGGVYLAWLHLLPPLSEENLKKLDTSESEFPLYAADAVGYGFGAPVMSPDGPSSWNTKRHANLGGAVKEAKRYAEDHVVEDIDNVLSRRVNQMGEIAERWFLNSIR